jgi:hypothetical protein
MTRHLIPGEIEPKAPRVLDCATSMNPTIQHREVSYPLEEPLSLSEDSQVQIPRTPPLRRSTKLDVEHAKVFGHCVEQPRAFGSFSPAAVQVRLGALYRFRRDRTQGPLIAELKHWLPLSRPSPPRIEVTTQPKTFPNTEPWFDFPVKVTFSASHFLQLMFARVMTMMHL